MKRTYAEKAARSQHKKLIDRLTRLADAFHAKGDLEAEADHVRRIQQAEARERRRRAKVETTDPETDGDEPFDDEMYTPVEFTATLTPQKPLPEKVAADMRSFLQRIRASVTPTDVAEVKALAAPRPDPPTPKLPSEMSPDELAARAIRRTEAAARGNYEGAQRVVATASWSSARGFHNVTGPKRSKGGPCGSGFCS